MPKKKSPQPIVVTATLQFGPQLLEEFTQRVVEWTREHHPERLLPPEAPPAPQPAAEKWTDLAGAAFEAYYQEQLLLPGGNVRRHGPAEVEEAKDARYT